MRQHLTTRQNNCAIHFKFKAIINFDYTIYKKKLQYSKQNFHATINNMLLIVQKSKQKFPHKNCLG